MIYKYVILDIDGTLTDGSIYYGNDVDELKKFSVKDAAGIFAGMECGLKFIVITGRQSNCVMKRMSDLKITCVFQNVKDKKKFLEHYFKEHSICIDECIYIGDDLNDYEAMKSVGFKACPKDACTEIRNISDYISSYNGGCGAVRDIVEHLLRKEQLWDGAISKIYGAGV